jgi:hypothetical protein
LLSLFSRQQIKNLNFFKKPLNINDYIKDIFNKNFIEMESMDEEEKKLLTITEKNHSKKSIPSKIKLCSRVKYKDLNKKASEEEILTMFKANNLIHLIFYVYFGIIENINYIKIEETIDIFKREVEILKAITYDKSLDMTMIEVKGKGILLKNILWKNIRNKINLLILRHMKLF